MKKTLTLLFLAVALSGCATQKDLVKILNGLKDDPASFSAGHQGIWGSFHVTRSNAGTNQTATVEADGTIKINPK